MLLFFTVILGLVTLSFSNFVMSFRTETTELMSSITSVNLEILGALLER